MVSVAGVEEGSGVIGSRSHEHIMGSPEYIIAVLFSKILPNLFVSIRFGSTSCHDDFTTSIHKSLHCRFHLTIRISLALDTDFDAIDLEDGFDILALPLLNKEFMAIILQ